MAISSDSWNSYVQVNGVKTSFLFSFNFRSFPLGIKAQPHFCEQTNQSSMETRGFQTVSASFTTKTSSKLCNKPINTSINLPNSSNISIKSSPLYKC